MTTQAYTITRFISPFLFLLSGVPCMHALLVRSLLEKAFLLYSYVTK